ncbi:MAG: c-type cytochrome [Bryobacteraceae bacterium]|nr:c-type cytochrome [Bryobacteraceae bacterium]
MKTIFLSIGFIVAMSLPLAAAGDAAKGKELYTKRCKICHADDGAGTPALQKKYGAKLLPLAGKEVQAMKDPDITKSFSEAVNHKALLKSLQPGDLDNVIAYIRTMKK